ncbi:MAG: DNA-binding protein [Salipiger marinus]|uniref:DNA-binding protein n=1 Tax=Salipiger marinus TaxID=555512 RepID=UPI00405978AD
MTDEKPPLSPDRFDALAQGPQRLWGLGRIAEFLGVSRDKARRLAKDAGCPIYRPDGTSYFALRAELLTWLKRK